MKTIMLNLRRLIRLPRIRKKRFLLLITVIGIMYFVYQFGFISELSQVKKAGGSNARYDRSVFKVQDNKSNNHPNTPEQINNKVKVELESRTHGSVFKCKLSNKLISSDKVNDDYCDCPEDGADEFLTEACDNAMFLCKSYKVGFPSKIVSAWVNDGVCDCCDGSDEWQEKTLISLPFNLQKKINRYISPCPKLC